MIKKLRKLAIVSNEKTTFYRECFFVFSCCRLKVFLLFLQDSTLKPIPIMLCGNKTDLRESYAEEGKTVIPTEKGEKLAKVRLHVNFLI